MSVKMREDYEDRSVMAPAVVMTILAVTVFVGGLMAAMLFMNERPKRNPASQGVQQADAQQAAKEAARPVILYSDEEPPASGQGRHPDDFAFWDMYPKETETPPPAEETEELPEEEDPSTDGKHTLVKNPDGTEEWVLISQKLPKHEYDFTKLVCQSDRMRYYENGRQVSYVGVDISKLQDYVDFVKVKKSGVDFVMLRLGARGYGTGQLILDESFSDNIRRATNAGLDVGVYFYSQAITAEEAVEEADMVLQNLGEYRLTYPVAFDMERVENDTARTDILTKAEKTAIAKTFLDAVAAAGYKTMIYGDKEWLIKEIDMSKLTAYDIWLSQPADIPDYPYRFAMWQYSFAGSVDGITGYANMDISFVNYSEK